MVDESTVAVSEYHSVEEKQLLVKGTELMVGFTGGS